MRDCDSDKGEGSSKIPDILQISYVNVPSTAAAMERPLWSHYSVIKFSGAMAGEIEEGAKAERGGRRGGGIGGNFLDWPYSESQLAPSLPPSLIRLT